MAVAVRAVEKEDAGEGGRKKFVPISTRIRPEYNEVLEKVANTIHISKYHLVATILEAEAVRMAMQLVIASEILEEVTRRMDEMERKLMKEIETIKSMVARIHGMLAEDKLRSG